MSVELLLNTTENELRDPGWGKTLSALQIVHREPLDGGLWREPITGAVMLRPSPFLPEWREGDTYEGDKLTAEDFHRRELFWETAYIREGLRDPFLSLGYPAGSMPGDVELDTGLGMGGLIEGYGEGLVWALQSKDNFALNQGLYLEVRHLGFTYDRAADYLAIVFGQYALKVRTDGTALLLRYQPRENEWSQLQAMRFAGPSEQHGEGFSVVVLPVLGNRLHFYYSSLRPVDAASESERLPSPRGSSHAYRVPRSEERWDSLARVWRVVDEGPLRIAVSPGRRYFFQIGKVRFAAGQHTVYLGHDDLGAPLAKPPKITLHGYLPGDGEMEGLVLDADTGGVFSVGDSTKPQPRVLLTGAVSGPWSPELHAVTVQFAPRIASVQRDALDVSDDVMRLRVRLSDDTQPQTLQATLRQPVGLPLRAGIPCRLSLGSTPLFRGEVVSVTSRDGLPGQTVTLRMRDGWSRLEGVQAAPSPAFDGWIHTEVVRYLLGRAGVPDNEMDIAEGDGTLPGGGQTDEEPDAIPLSPSLNDWRFCAKPGDTVADMLRLICTQFSGWSLRHDAGVWRYRPLPQGQEPDLWVFARTADYVESSEPDERKLRALTLRRVVVPPEFNVLYVYGADGSRDAQRVMTYERNLSSIQQPASDDYLGRAVEAHRTASWATTAEACARVSRLLMTEKGRSRHLCVFTCEWQPTVLPGSMVSVVGISGEGLGEYRLSDVQIETGGRLGSWVHVRCTGVAPSD
ncbi:MAG: hypothetical protein HRF45_10900 [Fimbriimonadia bacterium]|jgi:hypothetical protein